MHAMVLDAPGRPLVLREIETPEPGPGQVLVKVQACGVCRTDLHIVDGDLTEARYPIIPGHEVVGSVVSVGGDVAGFRPGDRVGIPWLGSTCGACAYCRMDRENLCDAPGFTGYTINGGYADYTIADHRYCFPIPDHFDAIQAAPLLCAGLIGHRCLVHAGDGRRLGLYGFGAAAHIVAQVAAQEGREVYALTRPGDGAAQDFARQLGAVWVGDSDQRPPVELDAAIIFAPVGAPGPGGA